MKTRVLIIVSLFFSVQLYAADYYWVGGAGNWNDLNHWRLGSGSGSIPSIVPSPSDNVFFTAGSGFGTTTATNTVTLNANGFCNNMTWTNVPNAPRFVASSSSFRLEVFGNASLSPVTTYSVTIAFKGATVNTLKTNGPVLGNFTHVIEKATGGTLTVTDSLVQAGTISISLISGTFDITGKKVMAGSFNSNNANVRTLEMTNAHMTITGTGDFRFNGANKTLQASGSYMECYVFYTDGGIYNKVACHGGTWYDQLGIDNTVFSTLTFANDLGTIAGINNGNTISDSLIFMGTGSIGNDNNIGYIYFNKRGDVNGANNVMRKIECRDILQFSPELNLSNANTVDSLLLASSRLTALDGTLNINNYLYLQGTNCEAFSEINGDSTNGVVNFGAAAVVNISNVIITGVKATGSVTPVPVTGFNGGNNTGFTFNEPPNAAGTTLYWVNGPGDWNDRNHWSTSSGGTGGACIPFRNDNVIFDANSGLASGTVTTSGGSFCHNMTWSGVGDVTFSESFTSSFNIYGSLVMDPSVTMNTLMEFEGSDPASITTNGSTLGGQQFIIQKTEAAVVTLTDDWINPTGGSLVHTSGGVNLSGRTVNLLFYTSAIDAPRSLDIANATLNFTQYWDYRGASKSILSTGSYIAAPVFHTDGLNYSTVDVTGVGIPFITGTTFGQLTFTDASATSPVGIGLLNTIRRLEFKGKGLVNGGGNSIDTLILAGSRNYTFVGTNTINNYLKAQSTPCTGLSEIKGNPTGTWSFASGATVDIDNVYMQNMTATGLGTSIYVNGADAGGNTGFTFSPLAGGPRYWVGGKGKWNDPMHWSATSGGPGGACVPSVSNDVFFDAGSFSAPTDSVIIADGHAYCHSMNWTGITQPATLYKDPNFKLEVWGDLVLNPVLNMYTPVETSPASYGLRLTGPANSILDPNNVTGAFDFVVDKANGGIVTLTNDYINSTTHMEVYNGELDLSGRTITVGWISDAALSIPHSMDITNATINAGWHYMGANKSLQASGSTINASFFRANDGNYNVVNVTASDNSNDISNTTIDSLVFTDPSDGSEAAIGGTNTINYLEFKGKGFINGTGNSIGDLVFYPGKQYSFLSGSNNTITGNWYGSGTPCRLTEVVSSSSTNATITKTSGNVTFDYVRLQGIAGTGGATYSTQSHSIDLGGNTGWTMTPYDGAAPIYGLGPDTAVAPAGFPITLRTDGFFGDPSSQYLWNDNSTADTLLVTGPGTYSVQVNLADGCNISDAITVTEASTLPITLEQFTARLQDNCSGVQLNWTTSSEQNSKDFTIQRSPDGGNWSNIGTIAAAGNSIVMQQYSYTDAGISGGSYVYRLLLNDIDERQKISKQVSVRLDCATGKFFIYPNPVLTMLTIQAPAAGGQKILAVYTATGQRVMQTTIQPGAVKTIPTHDWKQGVYMVIITENNKQVLMQKLMKQ